MGRRAMAAALLAVAGISWLLASGVQGRPRAFGAGHAHKGGPVARKLGHELADLMRATGRGAVLVDAVAESDGALLLSQLQRLGLSHGASYGRMVSGRLPPAALQAAADLPELRFLRPSRPLTRAGAVTSQGDAAIRADLARANHALDGAGITVGVLSDSFDCSGTGTATDIAGGDLPAATTILDDAGCPGYDEGRAMAQVIHDVAPGAAIVFHTAGNGQADLAAGIAQLVEDVGVDVIVENVLYPREPMFQDGIVAQAIEDAVAQGVPVVSAAGNHGRRSYDATYRPSGMDVLFGGNAHDFDPGGGVDVYQGLTLAAGEELIVVLQWDASFFSVSGAPGSPNDLDICLMDEPPTTTIACGEDLNIGGDPVEVITFANDGSWGASFNLVVELFDGPAPRRIKTVLLRAGAFLEYDTAGSTIYGHPNAAATLGVGATFYADTPAFGADPALVSSDSSAGGTPVLFDLSGDPLPTPEVREQPRLVGPDGVNTTFFGTDISDPGDGSDRDKKPNFFGTSAAAAHAAGIVALLRQRNPGAPPGFLTGVLESTADDMDDPSTAGFDTGFDFATGFGLMDAAAAAAAVPLCGDAIVEAPEECDDGNTMEDDACGNDCLNNVCGDGVVHTILGEQCDDGNGVDTDFCRNDCLWNYCGDGRITNVSVELLSNGNFETGTLAGWEPYNLGDGNFMISMPGAETPLSRRASTENPAGGLFYAVSDSINIGTHALAQPFTIPATAGNVTLSFQMFVNDHSGAGPLMDPNGLDYTAGPNQHARVDLLAPGSSPLDTGPGVVANLYSGVDSGAIPNPYVSYQFDLLGLVAAGNAYELRFAEVNNQFFQNQGIDNVSVRASLAEECDDGNDIDGDGCSAGCLLECSPPVEVGGLNVQAGGVIQWVATPGGLYDLLRSNALPLTGAGEACIAAETSDTFASDNADPAAGQIYHYLVREHAPCGHGTYGHGSDGTERSSSACP